MEGIKRKSRIFMLYICAFYAFYTPNFVKMQYFNNIVALGMLIIMLLPDIITKFKNFKKEFSHKNLIFLIGGILLAGMFFFIRALFAGAELTDFKELRIVQSNINIIFILLMVVIIKRLEGLGYSREQKIRFVLNIAVIQGIICILMYIFPTLRSIVTEVLFKFGEGNEFTLAKRGYGIASNYTFATPIFHGILGTMAVIYAILKNKKYVLYLPFIVVSIILNGRTGLFILIFGIVLVLTYFCIKLKYVKKILKILAIMIPIMIISITIFSNVFEEGMDFVNRGIQDVLNLMNGEKTGNFEILYSDYLSMPEVNPIFGEGYRPHGTDIPDWVPEEYRTDMGYINDFVMGGMLYMILLYIPYMQFVLYKPKKQLNVEDQSICKIFSIFMFLTLIIVGFKGEPLRATIIVSAIVYLKMVLAEPTVNEGESKNGISAKSFSYYGNV